MDWETQLRRNRARREWLEQTSGRGWREQRIADAVYNGCAVVFWLAVAWALLKVLGVLE